MATLFLKAPHTDRTVCTLTIQFSCYCDYYHWQQPN